MTFVVYIFTISVFFFALKNNVAYEIKNVKIQTEFFFDRLDQIYDKDYDFLDGVKIDEDKLNAFLESQYSNPNVVYDFVFRDLEIHYFKKMMYCVFIENKNNKVIKNFAASNYENTIYFLDLNNTKNYCGSNKDKIYTSYPKCNTKEAIMLSKPVLYKNSLHKLNLLLCAE